MLPKWEDLPRGPMTNRQLVDYVRGFLTPLFTSENFITSTRIQNYVKWGVLSQPDGRRYNRVHLAEAIIVSILKGVLTTQEIAQGISLQLLLLSTEEAYNAFSRAFEEAKAEVEYFISYGETLENKSKHPALTGVCRAFCYRALSKDIIRLGGLEGFKGEKSG
ncbi:MAG TPA: DUF1836 domain-containing protein [Clostridia bacterium]|nr:DUF1836 domain-containing protein [Clostridia bacterium]